RTQALELTVRVEHHRRQREAPRPPRCTGMKADHEERMPAEAEAEARILRIRADVIRPRRTPSRVEVMQPLQLCPQQGFKAMLVGSPRPAEDGSQGVQRMSVIA